MKIIVDLTIGNSILFLAGGEIKAQAQINQHPYRKYNPLKSMHTRTEIWSKTNNKKDSKKNKQ